MRRPRPPITQRTSGLTQEHDLEHFFRGVCICPCARCTERLGSDGIRCKCPDCPAPRCGAKHGYREAS